MNLLKKISKIVVFLISFLIGGVCMVWNSTFGDYDMWAYDIIVNPVLFFTYGVLILIYAQLSKNSYKNQYIYLIFIPVMVVLVSQLWRQNFHKKIVLEGTVEDGRESSLTLFDDNTFEIKVQKQHGISIKKGKYVKNQKEINLNRKEIFSLTDSLFSQRYFIRNDVELVSDIYKCSKIKLNINNLK